MLQMLKNKFANFWQNTCKFKRQFWQIKSNLQPSLLIIQILKMTLGFQAKTGNKLLLCNWIITNFFSHKSVLFPLKMIKYFLRNCKVCDINLLIWALRMQHTHSEGGWLINWNKRINIKNMKNQRGGYHQRVWADSVGTNHDRGHLFTSFIFEVSSIQAGLVDLL